MLLLNLAEVSPATSLEMFSSGGHLSPAQIFWIKDVVKTFSKFLSIAAEVYIIYKPFLLGLFQVILDQIHIMIIPPGHRCSMTISIIHVPTPIIIVTETSNIASIS